MDKRINDISSRLREYSLGRFDKQLQLSPLLDEVDAISNGINMLGEELKAITISRDYFTNIFNSVSDMVFVLDNKGVINDVNKAAEDQLKYTVGTLTGMHFDKLHKGTFSCFNKIRAQLKKQESLVENDNVLYTSEGEMIQVRLKASYFKKERRKQLILLTASDISFQVKTENLIIRAIINTQEKERNRLAKDLHDSLAQQLSAIKFYISATVGQAKNKEHKNNLLKSNEALTDVIADMRNICFNLMPRTLEEFGLVKGVKEFCNHSVYNDKVHFIIDQRTKLPDFLPDLKIDLYRVIQEFITNAIKHGKADTVTITFACSKNVLKIVLIDNGVGFDCSVATKGMGLQNLRSRVKSHDGTLTMVSNPGKGTCYTITIPLK